MAGIIRWTDLSNSLQSAGVSGSVPLTTNNGVVTYNDLDSTLKGYVDGNSYPAATPNGLVKWHDLVYDLQHRMKFWAQPLVRDTSYSWWCYPISVYDSTTGNNYFSGIDDAGNYCLFLYKNNSITKLILHPITDKDEHNTASFLVMSDNIHCAWSGHNINNLWVQKIAKDLSGTLSTKTDIAASTGMSVSSYTQQFQAGGKMFITSRCSHYTWNITWSSDGGTTWATSKAIFTKPTTTGEYLYTMFCPIDSNNVQFGIYYHADAANDTNRFMLYKLNASTGDITLAGALITNLYSGFTSINVSLYGAVFTATTGYGFRFLDICRDASYTYILIAEFLVADKTIGKYKLKKIDAATNTLVQTVDIVDHGIDTFPTYYGGAYFVKNDSYIWNNYITLCREASAIFYTEVWKYDGSSVVLKRSVDSLARGVNGLSLTRPMPPLNSDSAGLQMIYQKGDNNEDYTNWVNKLMLVINKGSNASFLNVDGITSSVFLGRSILPSTNTVFSLYIRFRMNGNGGNSSLTNNLLWSGIADSEATTTAANNLVIRYNNAGLLVYRIGTATATSASGVITAGNWYKLVITFSSGVSRLYLNGTQILTNTSGTQIGGALSRYYLGAPSLASSINRVNASVDKLVMINSVLSAADVTSIQNDTFNFAATSRFADYDFNGSLEDISGNDWFGIPSGTITYG